MQFRWFQYVVPVLVQWFNCSITIISMFHLQIDMSPIEIELCSPLQVEHTYKIYINCAIQTITAVGFNRFNTSIASNPIRWSRCRGHRGWTPDPPVVPTRSCANCHHRQKETARRRWCLQAAIATIVTAAITTTIAPGVDASYGDCSLPRSVHNHRCCNHHHQSSMEPPIWSAAMEMPTLEATGSGHFSVGGETLAVATSSDYREQRLTRGQDCVAASLGYRVVRRWNPVVSGTVAVWQASGVGKWWRQKLSGVKL
jgi:hypothetical protein